MSDDLCTDGGIARTHSEDGLSSNTDAYRTSPGVAPSPQNIAPLSNPAAKTNDLSPPAESFSSSSASGRTPSALKQSASTPGIDRLPSELIAAHVAEFFPYTQTAPKVLDSEYTHLPRRDVDDEDDERDEKDEDEDEDETVERNEMSAAPAQNGIEWIRGALIGSGSFGSVYLGMNKVTGMLMAVKQLELPSVSSHNEEHKKSILTELQREIDVLKDLEHDNIAQYLDSSIDGQYFNIFLTYVPGGSVAALLKDYGAFEGSLVRNFVRQVLHGLNYLHERGIIHRNIKGGNILVDNKGGIKIADFGISKEVADDIQNISNSPSLQSAFWMAPEVVKQSSYTSKADIWSLGCLVVEMFTAQHPYPELSQMQAIFQIGQSVKPATPDGISSDAEDFLNQTFEIDYQARPSAAELVTHPWIIGGSANAKDTSA